MSFSGWPNEAITFFAELEADNTKEFWNAHRSTYESAVKAPTDALLEELTSEFGAGKMFRPYRDIRFSADKSPYKTHVAAVIHGEGMTGFYFQLSAHMLYAASGCYMLANDQLQKMREAIVDDSSGSALEAIVADLEKDGYRVYGEVLKTVPRGFPKDHPRARLLKHKDIHAGRELTIAPWLHTPEARERIAEVWRGLGPLNDWLERYVGPSALPQERWGG